MIGVEQEAVKEDRGRSTKFVTLKGAGGSLSPTDRDFPGVLVCRHECSEIPAEAISSGLLTSAGELPRIQERVSFLRTAGKEARTIRSSERHRPSGHTLIELMVMLTIIGLLLALFIPRLALSRARATHAACVSNLRNLGAALQIYANDNEGDYPDSLQALTLGNPAPLGRIPTCPSDHSDYQDILPGGPRRQEIHPGLQWSSSSADGPHREGISAVLFQRADRPGGQAMTRTLDSGCSVERVSQGRLP